MNILKEKIPTLDSTIKISTISLYRLIISGLAAWSHYIKNLSNMSIKGDTSKEW